MRSATSPRAELERGTLRRLVNIETDLAGTYQHALASIGPTPVTERLRDIHSEHLGAIHLLTFHAVSVPLQPLHCAPRGASSWLVQLDWLLLLWLRESSLCRAYAGALESGDLCAPAKGLIETVLLPAVELHATELERRSRPA